MSTTTTETKKKSLQTSLELVEKGTPEQFEEFARKGRKEQMPEGVTSKMLYSDVFRIAWPSLVELTLTQLASMVDLMMVGSLGAWALTAVGLTTQPKFLLMTLFMAMNVGATAMVARHKGAGNQDRAQLAVRQAMLLTFVLSLAMSIIGYIFAPQLILFMGASEQATLDGGVIYLRIQMMGFVFMAITSSVTAVLRGVGDSRTAMVYNLVANLSNVVLNYLLIYSTRTITVFGASFTMWGAGMGVAGASLATALGQIFAFFMAMYAITRKTNYLYLDFRKGFKPDKDALSNIFAIGFPSMIEQLFMRAGMIAFSKIVAGLGTVAYATHQVCMNIQALSFMNGQAFGVSATSLMGQSLGRQRVDMAQSYTKRARNMGMLVAAVLAVVFFFFGGNIVALYNSEPEIVTTGALIMTIIAIIQPLQASQFITAGALRGAGDTKATAAVIFVTTLFLRPILAYVLINNFGMGLVGAWVAMVIDQALRSLLIAMRFASGKWMHHRFK